MEDEATALREQLVKAQTEVHTRGRGLALPRGLPHGLPRGGEAWPSEEARQWCEDWECGQAWGAM